jgi:heme oxygenase
MLDIHTGIELTVFPAVGTLVPDLDERSKTQRLMEDLKQLGIASPAAGQTFADARYSENPAFNLGILYVSEGSTLGGKVIMKNILAATKPGINEACRFLDAYGDRTGSRWKTFLTILDGYQAHADERTRSRIIEGARYGFERTASLFQNASATL